MLRNGNCVTLAYIYHKVNKNEVDIPLYHVDNGASDQSLDGLPDTYPTKVWLTVHPCPRATTESNPVVYELKVTGLEHEVSFGLMPSIAGT